METLFQDFRYGFRMALKSPGFTAVALITLALGIGANTAVFSIVNGVLLNPLPFPQADQLVALGESKANFENGSISYPNFRDWQRDNRSFSSMAVSRVFSFSLIGVGEPEQVDGDLVSSEFFSILGVKPIKGRLFMAGEDEVGAAPVALIGEDLWRRKFSSSPEIVGKSITLGPKSYTVVGIIPAKITSRPTSIDGDGNHVKNLILSGLSSSEYGTLFPKLEFVRLKLHQVLYEPGDRIKSGYFINSGMMSILAVQPDGKSVEVGLVGKEGFVGLPLIVGYSSSPTRIVTQGDGAAYRCDGEVLRQTMRKCPALEQRLHRYSQQLAMQTTQIAACNRLHDVEERLARWILMTQDRIGSDRLPLTQEFLAQMLGSRRSSVTVAAGTLQKAGLISYTRGSVAISDRRRLEDAACDCYAIVQEQLRQWEAEPKL